ncbi:cAMP-dependent protein kinase regulator [Fragilaria crotonensis]|nr:cAMP-dependent protein kinase regulator [Fragilaria crotonensis]
MGCNSSKNVQTTGQGPAPTTTTPTTSPPTGVVEHVERVVSSALEALHEGNTSVMDQISLAKQIVVKTKSTIQTKARNLQIIFATPLEFLDSATYQPPSFPKTTEEADFIRTAILQNFVFSNINESQLKTMIMAFEQVSFPQNATVIQQGDVGDYFYVIRHGAVQFLKNNKAIPGQTEPATSGQTFGELALLYHAPRAATCIVSSKEPAILYRVDQKDFPIHSTDADATCRQD